MSHAYGEVVHDGRVVAHYEYSGTSDIAYSALWATEDEVRAHWRAGPARECSCGGEPLNVLIYTYYGGGFHWPGQACLKCMALVGPNLGPGCAAAYNDEHPDTTDGHPLHKCPCGRFMTHEWSRDDNLYWRCRRCPETPRDLGAESGSGPVSDGV